MIEIDKVSKKYKDVKVLEDISFSLAEGEIHGLIGPNGSGKTTLINLITQIIFPHKGIIRGNNHNLNLGCSIGRKGFYENLSIRRNLKMIQIIKRSADNLDFLLDFFQLTAIKSKKYRKLSEGTKQKVSILSAFIGNPNYILLDEPTTNLDVDAQQKLFELILIYQKRGTGFLISSHVLSELEKICRKITFIKDGNIISQDSIENYHFRYQNLENAYKEILQ